jgi:hypothetical protein
MTVDVKMCTFCSWHVCEKNCLVVGNGVGWLVYIFSKFSVQAVKRSKECGDGKALVSMVAELVDGVGLECELLLLPSVF